MTHRHDRLLHVAALARVEGEGAMRVRVTGGTVTDVQLDIYEPPRFFEALLRGRGHTEPPDITSRICGICPVAYQMSACAALEDACGITVDSGIQDLRRLLYCGEWISSHALHIYLLHAPDFLGYSGAVDMARDQRPVVERGLRLKQAGNMIMERLGGRAIHPVNVRIGGFHRLPTRTELDSLVDPLTRALDDALDTVTMAAGFDFPEYECRHEWLALVDPRQRYPIDGGVPHTSQDSFPLREYTSHVVEHQVSHSTALHARLADGSRLLTGPLARYALNHDRLSPLARQTARSAGLDSVCRNPFRSIIVRAVETVYAVEEALRIIASYEPPPRPAVPVPPVAATGYGATEAPRGVLFHSYTLDDSGTVLAANIVPPTAQNQTAMEHDLRGFVQDHLGLDDHSLTHACEQAIRNYDPCISCSTHFLDLTVERD